MGCAPLCQDLDNVGFGRRNKRHKGLGSQSFSTPPLVVELFQVQTPILLLHQFLSPGTLASEKKPLGAELEKGKQLFPFELVLNSGQSHYLCLASGFVLSIETYAAKQTLGCSSFTNIEKKAQGWGLLRFTSGQGLLADHVPRAPSSS